MRGDLTANEFVYEVETDLDSKTAKISLNRSVDLTVLLDDLAAKNNKFEEWSREDPQ
ncbi:MAG: hypothetical protein ACR2NP_00010 [Pirellulaceae bacterium]